MMSPMLRAIPFNLVSSDAVLANEGGAGPAEVKRAVRKGRCTVVGLVPSVLEALDEADEDHDPCTGRVTIAQIGSKK